MKILMYGWEFPPYISGGLGVACHAIVHALAQQGAQVNLVLPQAFDIISDKSNINIFGCGFLKRLSTSRTKSFNQNSDTQRYRQWENFLSPYDSHLFERSNASTATWMEALEKMLATHRTTGNFNGKYGKNLISEVYRYGIVAGAFAAEVPHDCIHCHDWLTILAGIEAKRYSKKPLIFQIHALETDRSGEFINRDVHKIEKLGMEEADKIIAVSQYTKNAIVKHYRINPKKIDVAHNGINKRDFLNPSQLYAKPPFKTVLFLGRITHQKGPSYFIRAAKKILAHRQDVHFVLVGKGDLMRQTIEQAAYERIGPYVHFTGFINRKEIGQIYKNADVYVMPSVSEPFGLTCLEAIAQKVPTIISKQSGVSEVAPHALKVDFWDINEMASKIIALLRYPVLHRTLAENAHDALHHVTWEATANTLLNVYRKTIKEKSAIETVA
jgi:glycosyltransferase involved in cell wall biosynthesis